MLFNISYILNKSISFFIIYSLVSRIYISISFYIISCKKPIKINKDKKVESKKKKKKDVVMEKAIKMVILNTSLAKLFKIPLSFMSIVNVMTEFYFKKSKFF